MPVPMIEKQCLWTGFTFLGVGEYKLIAYSHRTHTHTHTHSFLTRKAISEIDSTLKRYFKS